MDEVSDNRGSRCLQTEFNAIRSTNVDICRILLMDEVSDNRGSRRLQTCNQVNGCSICRGLCMMIVDIFRLMHDDCRHQNSGWMSSRHLQNSGLCMRPMIIDICRQNYAIRTDGCRHLQTEFSWLAIRSTDGCRHRIRAYANTDVDTEF